MTRRPIPIQFTLNGQPTEISTLPGRRLSDILREDLRLTGTKIGCDAGDCGACTVLLDGKPVCACLMSSAQVANREITTIEGLNGAKLDRLQNAFLRHGAAQCGICTPGMMMAATGLLNANPRPTMAQAKEALGGVLCRCTGYRKILTAVCDNWRDPAPNPMPEAGSAIGARIQRLDGTEKVTGTDIFGADAWPDNTLLVRTIRSPHHAAAFTFGDIEAWRAANPGTVAVFTASDIPGRNCFGVIAPFADQPALATGIARFRGEAVALVAGEADTMPSLDLTDFPVVWTPLPHTLDPEPALDRDAPQLHSDRPGNILIEGLVVSGDAEAALEAATHIAQGHMTTAYVEHAYIEPEAGVAWFEDDILVIQACTQAPYMDREDTAAILGLPLDRVRIIPTSTGGGFGSKLDISVQPLIGLVVLKTGRPARMVYTRTESMTATTKRHPARMSARIGIDALGKVIAMQFDGDFNTGPYASWGPTVANRVPVHASGPYRTPNYRAKARAIHTNGAISGAFRGFGVPQAALLQETLYDDLARACGLDRLEFRQHNAFCDGDTTATGQHLKAGVGITQCLDALLPHWQRALADAATANLADTGNLRRGVGLASCWYGCGNTSLPNPSTIKLGISPAGDLILHQGATDIGQGSNTVITQICADALGLPVAAFRLLGGDTAITPDAGKTSASRQTYVSGKAAEKAGRALRAAILRHANVSDKASLSLSKTTLTVSDGGATRNIDLQSLEPDTNGFVFHASESYDPPTTPLDKNGQGDPYAVYGYGAQMAELQVDEALGTVKLIKITAAHDLGRVINPTLAEGQIEGGIAQGIGMALMEEYIPGRTDNLHDYLIPTIGDVPEIETILIEVPDPEGPFGAKGLGEHALIPTAPAILNAIKDATGAHITELPALPHRVLQAINAARAQP